MTSSFCDVCNTVVERAWTCIQCNNDSFCEGCWNRERAHRPGAVGHDGRPHEKTDPRIVERLRDILEPKLTLEQQQELHMWDDDTTWFGIQRDSENTPTLHDYGRYSTIMASSRTTEFKIRYPQLISFIGQTGAGKSTLIKMMIENQKANSGDRYDSDLFPSPVTGSAGDNVPTSGDVHLYSDPATYYQEKIMLYADCEGLDGGETIPRGVRHRLREDKMHSNPSGQKNNPKIRRKLRKAAHKSQRTLSWATTPKTCRREYAVTQLYPRILYAFSDVVVFVLRESRTFESVVLEKLLGWASASIEQSLNQPALPHVVIVVNATSLNIPEELWDVQIATETLMRDIANAIYHEPRYQAYANHWRQTDRTIETTRDLLECYYASVTVVRVPMQGRYMLMHQQILKLHAHVQRCCNISTSAKKRVRMLTDSEKLQTFLQSAFDHFSSNLHAPFDFVEEALKHNPIPRDFGGNVLKLAIAVRDNNKFGTRYDGPGIFKFLSRMVASCLMLDFARQGLLGSTEKLLDDVYAKMCEEALDNFCYTYWPCSFKSELGEECCNVKSGHDPKGHQNSNGKIIGAGQYESDFQFEDYAEEWITDIHHHLGDIHKRVQDSSVKHRDWTEAKAASELHLDIMRDFYSKVGDVYQYSSHSTCFSCLRELPEHPLPCNHVLCTPCIMAYGKQVEKTMVALKSCPLHSQEKVTNGFPWDIKIKPRYAGVRVLSLDGGGIRAICELEVLKAVEIALGGRLQIQAFFDLIVGTGTGGILAMWLGIEGYSVKICIHEFTRLCEEAFKPREILGVSINRRFKKLSMIHGSIYSAKALDAELQDRFQDSPIFGAPTIQDTYKIKVAVVAATPIEKQPVVLANYNRPDLQGIGEYAFERQDNSAMELKLWEAARATSATPPYFKPFVKHETKQGYVDGSIHHMNPVMIAHLERQFTWQDVELQNPDILLSIGSGQNKSLENDTLSSKSKPKGFFRSLLTVQDPVNRTSTPSAHRRNLSFATRNVAGNNFDNILTGEMIWDEFRESALRGPFAPNGLSEHQYIRLNPDLGPKIPTADAFAQFSQIQQMARTYAEDHDKQIRQIAQRLVASSFFFDKVEAYIGNTGQWNCAGSVCCRFTDGTSELIDLAQYILGHITTHFTPHLVIRNDSTRDKDVRIELTEEMLRQIIRGAGFSIEPISISTPHQDTITTIFLCLQGGYGSHSESMQFPISGFPRGLMKEGTYLEAKETSPKVPSDKGTSTANRPERRPKANSRGSSNDTAFINHGRSPPHLRRVRSNSNIRTSDGEISPREIGESPHYRTRSRISVDTASMPVYELDSGSRLPTPSIKSSSSSTPSSSDAKMRRRRHAYGPDST